MSLKCFVETINELIYTLVIDVKDYKKLRHNLKEKN